MLGDLIGLGAVVALAVGCGWLAWRAWGAARAWIRWPGVVLAGLGALLLTLGAVAIGRGILLFYSPRDIPVSDLKVAGLPEQIARGEHIAIVTCAACHTTVGNALPLSGGRNLSDEVGLPLGDLYPQNLTPAGSIATWTDGEILRAIREGVHQSGRVLAGMPWHRLRHLSDEDAQAVIAYLRSQPAVESDVPPTNPSLVAFLLTGVGMLSVDVQPVAGPVVAPPKGPTVEYGEYLVSYNDCRDCHGENLDGVREGPGPVGPNLVFVQNWTAEQFVQAMRTGVDPSGHTIQPPMPWQAYGQMDDDELTAVYLYVTSQRAAANN